MRLLPYDAFTLKTPDPLSIVLLRFATQVEPEKPVRWQFSRDHLPYEGTFSEAGFQIRRIIHHRNSFLPLIEGKFESLPMGTRVRITMRLHPFVIVFLAFWYLIWYGFFLPVWLTGAMPISVASQFLGLPIVLLIIFWCAFWAEAARSRWDLTQIIMGRANRSYSSPVFYQWLPNALQWGLFLAGITLALLQITGIFRPFASVESESESWATVSCSQVTPPPEACQLSLIHTLNGHPTAAALAVSGDGQTLVSGGTDKAIKVWDVKTGRLQTTLQSDSGKINAVAIAPDGKTVVSGSADHRVRIWDLTHAHPPRMLVGHSEAVNFVSITPDGKTVISGSYGAIKQWDLATGQLKATFPKVGQYQTTWGPIAVIHDEAEQFSPLDINPNRNIALISGLKIVDLTTNQTRSLPTDRVENLFVDNFLSAHISLDGKLAALQYGNAFKKFETRLKIWDLQTGKVQAISSAAFSHNMFENLPLALSRDRIFGTTGQFLKVWNLQTAQLEAVLETGWMGDLVVTPDGKLLAGLTSGFDPNQIQIKVWRHQPAVGKTKFDLPGQ